MELLRTIRPSSLPLLAILKNNSEVVDQFVSATPEKQTTKENNHIGASFKLLLSN